MTYTCARCHRTFETGWSDEEAMAECKANFGEMRKEELAIICDDCYKRIDPALHPHEVERAVAETIRAREAKP